MIKGQHGSKPLRQIRLVGCGEAAFAGAIFENTIRKLVDMVSNDIFVDAGAVDTTSALCYLSLSLCVVVGVFTAQYKLCRI